MKKTYKFSNTELVSLLKEVLSAMEVKNFNVFRIRAYQNVIMVIESLTVSVFNLWENNRLSEIQGAGETIRAHFEELFSTGKVVEFDAIKHDLPEGMFELIGMRGIGAKKAFKLATAFNLTNREDVLEKVKKAAEEGKIRKLPGFAEKSEIAILEALEDLKKTKGEKPRMMLYQAEQIAERLTSYMLSHPEVEKVEILGSFKRRKPTVADLDIVMLTNDPQAALNHFLKFSEIEEVLVSGDKRVSVVLGNDFQVDIRVCPKESYGSMVQYFTGSKAHNIVLRTYAIEKSMSLSEYGIKKAKKLHKFTNEQEFYEFIGLKYIPPEIRQGKNEVELSVQNRLPNLVTLDNIKGDVHMHTIVSTDAVNTLQEMAMKSIELGYDYIGISDHSPGVQSRGLDEVYKIVENGRKLIDAFNSSQDKIKVLYGFEVNLLADATMSLPDDILKNLDYAIGGVHGAFVQDRETMTNRLIAAMEHPYINILAHPSNRLINEREPVDLDWQKVLAAAKANDKIIEINAQPNRLDLPEDLVYDAVNKGINLVINTDAHAVDQLEYMKYGIDVARRGWCEKHNILNTLSYDEFLAMLAKSSDR